MHRGGNTRVSHLHTLCLYSYLREVGFPDNVLEARVARMTAYKNLYGQSQMLEQPPISNHSESPQPSVSWANEEHQHFHPLPTTFL